MHGFRNAQATVLAPTGTISFMMDCDTTGVEPDFSLVKSKKLVGGGEITIVNKTVPMALGELGYAPREVEEIVAYIDERGGVVGAPHLKTRALPRVRLRDRRARDPLHGAREDDGRGPAVHLGRDLEDGQPARADDDRRDRAALRRVVAARREGDRDLPRQLQGRAAALGSSSDKTAAALLAGRRHRGASRIRKRRRLPDDRTEVGRKFKVGEYEGYIHVGLFEDGTPGDIFVDIAKEGTTLAGLMNSFMISVSLGLQYGVPLEVYVSKFSHMRFEPSGMTNDAGHPRREVDRRLHLPLDGEEVPDRRPAGGGRDPDAGGEGAARGGVRARTPAPASAAAAFESAPPGQTALFNQWEDAVECASCGGRMVRTGSCYTCRDCGTNTGCS